MRKVLFLLTLVGLFYNQAEAQYTIPYTPFGLYNVPQALSPQNTVRVTPVSPPMYSNQIVCGVGPHVIGGFKSDGYNYAFSQGATRIQVELADVHDDDTVRFFVNGSPYVLTGINLLNSVTCPNPNTALATTGGDLTSVGTSAGPGTAVIVDINIGAALITNFRVRHMRSFGSTSGGVIYSIKYWEDTCDAALLTVTNNNPCTDRDLQLNATPFPNSTFSWTGPGGWTATGPNPVRPKVNILQGGQYNVTVQRGSCAPILGSTFVNLKSGPKLPIISKNTSPVCRGGSVDLDGYTTGITGVTYYWYGPNGFFNVGTPVTVPNIQVGQDGLYYLYAVSTDGCVSDTADTLVVMLPDVDGDFAYSIKYGCTADTLTIVNNSKGVTNGIEWYLNPTAGGAPTSINQFSTANDPVLTYIIPFDKHNLTPQDYELKVLAKNAACTDSLVVPITINHPLKADFEVDDDTICQNAVTINFTNKSSTAVVGTHGYLWNFDDGSPTETTYNVAHLYSLAGEYDASLIVTDYLDCKDTLVHRIFVDSTGAITFTATATEVCPGDLVGFQGNFSRIGNIGTVWDFDDGNKHVDTPATSYAFDVPGTYNVKFTALNRVCPDTTAKQDIVVRPQPTVNLGRDTSICPNGAPVVITDSINRNNPDARWQWNNNTRSRESSIIVRHPGVYSATVTIDGCSTTDSIMVAKGCYIDLPNAFTPNGDGTNDYFMPRQMLSQDVKTFKMTVFDRWGNQIFETNSAEGRGWDGKFNNEPQPLGVYIYVVNVTFTNNTAENYQGNVTLMR